MMSPLTFEGSIGRMPPRNAGAPLRWLVADVVKTSLPPPTAGTGAWTVSRDCALRARDASPQGAPKRWRDPLIVWHDRVMSPLRLPVLSAPIIRRVAWHLRRIGGQIDRRFFLTLAEGIVAFVAIAA